MGLSDTTECYNVKSSLTVSQSIRVYKDIAENLVWCLERGNVQNTQTKALLWMIIKRQHVKRLEAEYNDSVVAAKYD